VPIECFVKALYDPTWSVREAAAYALGEQGARAPITPLLLARSDQDSSVRDAVEWALQQIHPEMFATAPFNATTDSLDFSGQFTSIAADVLADEHDAMPDNRHQDRETPLSFTSDHPQARSSKQDRTASKTRMTPAHRTEQR